jgi:hypothetical protein
MTTTCACRSTDAIECILRRYPGSTHDDATMFPCCCACHDENDYDDCDEACTCGICDICDICEDYGCPDNPETGAGIGAAPEGQP